LFPDLTPEVALLVNPTLRPMQSTNQPARSQRITMRLWAAALLGDGRILSLRSETAFRSWQWTAAFLVILVGDYVTGPFIHSAILFYFIPIGMAAWSGARWWSLGLALLWPPLRLGFMALWGTPWPGWSAVEDMIVNGVVSVAFASLVWHVVEQERKLRLLRGMLPICSFCKRIRSEGEWQSVESYITGHSEAVFSHTFCPDCGEEHYGLRLS
jgi:hypothetical protein